MTTPYLQIKSFKKSFGEMVAVENVNLDVEKGDFVTFLGPSGSGKSTTLYALAGFQDPTEGDILLQGETLISTSPHKRNIGMVFQRYTLFPHLSVKENVAFPLKVRKLPQAEIDEKVAHVLKLVRLEGFEERMPPEMSGGQQQRVALARALAYDPPVLLMDEPLSALDKKLREEIQYEIKRIHQETGVTILYVTHDQEEALRLSDRIAVFNHGRIEQIGSGQELYDNPATKFVASFIGDSDFLDCEIIEIKDSKAKIKFPSGEIVDDINIHKSATEGTSAELMLRPERISLKKEHTGSTIKLDVEIDDVTFLGNNTHLAVKTSWGQALSVRLAYGSKQSGELALGDSITIYYNPQAAHVFC